MVSGRTSSTPRTRAPSQAAASAVASVDRSSITTTSSTRGTVSIRVRRTVATMWPTVASSSRAGRHTEIRRPCSTLRATRASASNSEACRGTGQGMGGVATAQSVGAGPEAAAFAFWAQRRARLTCRLRAHPERLRDGPDDAAATSEPSNRGARCQCPNDERAQSVGARSPGHPLDGARTEGRTPVRSRARRAASGEAAPETRRNHMAHVHALRCRECGREYDVPPILTCEWCFGPLEVTYDYDAIRASVSRESIGAGPLSIWRYADL